MSGFLPYQLAALLALATALAVADRPLRGRMGGAALEWTKLATPPFGHTAFGWNVAAYDPEQDIVLVRVLGNGGTTTDVYYPSNNTWRNDMSKTPVMESVKASAVGGKIPRLISTAGSSFWLFLPGARPSVIDVHGNDRPVLGMPFFGFGEGHSVAHGLNGTLVIFGGGRDKAEVGTVYVIDVGTESAERMPDTDETSVVRRTNHAAESDLRAKVMYVYGGQVNNIDNTYTYLKDVWRYSLAENVWVRVLTVTAWTAEQALGILPFTTTPAGDPLMLLLAGSRWISFASPPEHSADVLHLEGEPSDNKTRSLIVTVGDEEPEGITSWSASANRWNPGSSNEAYIFAVYQVLNEEGNAVDLKAEMWNLRVDMPRVMGSCDPGIADEACTMQQCTTEACLGIGAAVLMRHSGDAFGQCESDSEEYTQHCHKWADLRSGMSLIFFASVVDVSADLVNFVAITILLTLCIRRRLRVWCRLHKCIVFLSGICFLIDVLAQGFVIYEASRILTLQLDGFQCFSIGLGNEIMVKVTDLVQDTATFGIIMLLIATLGGIADLVDSWCVYRGSGGVISESPQGLLNVLLLSLLELALGFVDIYANQLELVAGLLQVEEAIANTGRFKEIDGETPGDSCMMVGPTVDFQLLQDDPPVQAYILGTLGGLAACCLAWCICCSGRVQQQGRGMLNESSIAEGTELSVLGDKVMDDEVRRRLLELEKENRRLRMEIEQYQRGSSKPIEGDPGVAISFPVGDFLLPDDPAIGKALTEPHDLRRSLGR